MDTRGWLILGTVIIISGCVTWALLRIRKRIALSIAAKSTTGFLKGETVRLAGRNTSYLAQLMILQGANAGREFAIGSMPIVRVGRDPQFNDLALYDSYMSNSHFSIRMENDQFFIMDEGSTNGTRLNEAMLSPKNQIPLKDGDIIEAGQTKLIFKSTFQRWNEQITKYLREAGSVKLADLKGLANEYQNTIFKDYMAREHSDFALVLTPDSRELSLERRKEFEVFKDAIQMFLSDTDESENTKAIQSMLTALVQSLDFQLSVANVNCYKDLYYTSLDTGSIFQGLNIPSQIPVVVIGKVIEMSQLDDIQYALKNIYSVPVQVFLLFTLHQNIDENHHLVMDKLTKLMAYDAVLFTPDDLYKIIATRKSRETFKQLVLSQVNLVTVSPYSTTGPIPDNVFFGRELEIRDIVEHAKDKSYAIIGGRRIGKSSLLGRLHRVRLPDAGFYALYHDCSVTPTYELFLNTVLHEWKPKSPNKIITFNDLLKSSVDKPVVLLLDEADKLVPAERISGWPLFYALRSLAYPGRIQVVLCGERTLRSALRDPESPLFNFANEILLGPLDFHAVEELVTRPIKQLEIELTNESEIVQRIYDFTSGHPNVVQRLCRRLIERLNEQGTRRITLNDVNAIIDAPKFQEEDFLNTYWERATPLEQILTLLMARETTSYHLRDVLDLLASEGLRPEPEVAKAALDRLVDLRSILKLSQAGYEFAVTAFPLVLANTTTTEDLLIVLKSQYRKNLMEVYE